MEKITNGQSLVKLSQYLLFVVKFYTLRGKFVLLVGPNKGVHDNYTDFTIAQNIETEENLTN